jgi:cytochrome P450
MSQAGIFDQILDQSNRADPYPLYARLRETPVSRQGDNLYVVSSYRGIAALMHDPRLGSDRRTPEERAAPDRQPSFINLDPPDHDRIRRLAVKHFGPPHTPWRVDAMRGELRGVVTRLIDDLAGENRIDPNRIDIVDQLAYPFPVAVICALLGVPREDEPRFSRWVDVIVNALDPQGELIDRNPQTIAVLEEFGQYLRDLIAAHRRDPGDDLLSAMATDDDPGGRLSEQELSSTTLLLLIAGHETTVNLIAHGVLTLLRHPDLLQRLRKESGMIIRLVEELARYQPSVQMITWRTALQDIDIEGTVIPAGASVTLAVAAGNRDPEQFDDPDVFDPYREGEHLGFGGGIRFCFGAALARLEAQIALTEFAQRMENPRLVADPPPYRSSPVLRGPLHLLVDVDRIVPAGPEAV